MWRRFGNERKERPLFPPRCDWWHAWACLTSQRKNAYTLDWFDDQLEQNINFSGLSFLQKTVPASVRFVAREARALLIALEVLADAKMRSQLTMFRVDASYDILHEIYQPWLPITLFSTSSSLVDPIVTTIGAATNITKLHLVISHKIDYSKGEELLQQGDVSRLLASMPQLEELFFEAHAMSTVAAIPDDVTFKHLRRLEFGCGNMVPEKLKAFL
ncbi:hypothetical protein AK830_g3347 [Neonectria ditissima]|uniref:Uncharacterized protein n=1 Tax=Neonectria ditissima TaxID=78410 RepID=A0A0P7BQG7_9HYPO|nr:hypothetical protein AK830_g3347 [Neonectria ditissima]